jgi:membrane protein DedA with SNARE-associated domain
MAAAVILVSVSGGDVFGFIEHGEASGTLYATEFVLVALDAVIPIFPGETTLNAASTVAANGEADILLVIVAGGLGAIVGDSCLYWIARASSRRVKPQLDRAQRNPRVATALDFLDHGAPVLLVFGRYVPGLRFVVNSTLGIEEYPYGKFLPWSALGGMGWSAYTCLLAYNVGSALGEYPVASILVSGLITTALIAAAYLTLKRRQ